MVQNKDSLKKMELKKKAIDKAGLLSEMFPEVSGIVIHMTYYHKSPNPILMERTVNFFPTSSAYFNMECMIKGCEDGGYNLMREIKRRVKERKKVSRGEMACKGKNGDLPSDHSSISYEINIKYRKRSSKK